MLLVVGAVIGSFSFIPGMRALPRWIRRAQCLVGITFVTAALLGFGLYAAGTRISYRLHSFIFFHIVVLAGMGLGIMALVITSGEYFKALRALDAARAERLAREARDSGD
jgi:hypothetical protein